MGFLPSYRQLVGRHCLDLSHPLARGIEVACIPLPQYGDMLTPQANFNTGNYKNSSSGGMTVNVGVTQFRTGAASAGIYGGVASSYVRCPFPQKVYNGVSFFVLFGTEFDLGSNVGKSGYPLIAFSRYNSERVQMTNGTIPTMRWSVHGPTYNSAVTLIGSEWAPGISWNIGGSWANDDGGYALGYRNGMLDATGTTPYTGLSDRTNDFVTDYVYIGADGTSAYNPWIISQYGFWSRKLTPDEQFWLNCEPWAMYRADPEVIYSLPAWKPAAPAPGGSAIPAIFNHYQRLRSA